LKSRYTLFIGLALGLIGVLVIGTLLLRRPYQFNGAVISPAMPAADFSLTTPASGTFRLSDQRGQVVVIYFGYTNCPDECPATLANFRLIIQKLGDRSKNVTFLFITVDPDRDTPQVLGEYTAQFDPEIIGLTGELSILEKVWQAYGVYREVNATSTTSTPTVAHTSLIYVIDKHGNIRLTYPYSYGPDGIFQDLSQLLKEK
jgi:protein SCO1